MTERAYQVVISFRFKPVSDHDNPETLRRLFRGSLIGYGRTEGMDVAVREIGAGGESSVMEGEGP